MEGGECRRNHRKKSLKKKDEKSRMLQMAIEMKWLNRLMKTEGDMSTTILENIFCY